MQFFRQRCRPSDTIPDYRSTLYSGEGIDLDITPGPHGIRIRNAIREPSLEFRSLAIRERWCFGMADVGRELKHCLDLLSGDPRKPFDELIDGCAVLEVFEECPHRHTGIGEHPHTADLCRVSLNCAAMIPRIHGASFTQLGTPITIYGRSRAGSIGVR